MAKKKVFSISSSLSDGLEQTIAAAHNYSSDLRIDIVPLKKISTDPDNPRNLLISLTDILEGISPLDPCLEQKTQELQSLETLAWSIKDQGIINPVLVYEDQGVYRLIAGERRTLASGLAGKTDIQAKILDSKPDEFKIRLLQWIENIERTDLSLAEKIDNLNKLVEAFARQNNILPSEVSVTNIAKIVGCVKSHAMNLKAVLEAEADLKEKIATNQIRSLEKAAIIAGIQSRQLRKSALELCSNGATLKALKLLSQQDKMRLEDKSLPSSATADFSAVSSLIHLGSTDNIKVARLLLDSLLSQANLAELASELHAIDFDNPKKLTQALRLVIKTLEQIHG